MTTYKKITLDGDKVQVDSAVRDGNGATISTTYAPIGNLHREYWSDEITLAATARSVTITDYYARQKITTALTNGYVFAFKVHYTNSNDTTYYLPVKMVSTSNDVTLHFAEDLPAGSCMVEFDSVLVEATI